MSDQPHGESVGRILHLLHRATRFGYLLTRDSPTPYLWQLRDAEDHTPIHSAETLDEIERWLNE